MPGTVFHQQMSHTHWNPQSSWLRNSNRSTYGAIPQVDLTFALSVSQPYRLPAVSWNWIKARTWVPFCPGVAVETWTLQIFSFLTFNPIQKHQLGAQLSKPLGP